MPEATPALPLAGLRVIELSTFLAGPFCAALLGDFGAEVLKVELPGSGDPLRRLGRRRGHSSLWWRQEGRNKKSLTCDLRRPEGQELLRRLVAVSDVLVENFQPGTLERWGLGYDALARINRGLIMARISAYGQTGPLAPKPGFGRIAHAFSGLTYLTGYPDRPPVLPGTPSIADYLSGALAAFGVLVALGHRQRTGEGQVVDVALYESVFRILEDVAVVYDQFGLVRQRQGPDHENSVPHNHYPTRDGKWIAIACTNDRMFQRLVRAMGRPELGDDPRYATVDARLQRRAEVDALVAAWTAALDQAEALARLDREEVPAGPIYTIAEIFQDAHYRARQAILAVPDPELGVLRMPGVVPRLERTPGRVRHPGPRLGEHTEEVLCGLLGYSPQEVARLRELGVV
jgi:crotonobetainyl-CoA:carnitine CoA-transferase CaiB-like acyl-CoA transferase